MNKLYGTPNHLILFFFLLTFTRSLCFHFFMFHCGGGANEWGASSHPKKAYFAEVSTALPYYFIVLKINKYFTMIHYSKSNVFLQSVTIWKPTLVFFLYFEGSSKINGNAVFTQQLSFFLDLTRPWLHGSRQRHNRVQQLKWSQVSAFSFNKNIVFGCRTLQICLQLAT